MSERIDTVTARVRHGTPHSYTLGCRCPDCKAKQAAYYQRCVGALAELLEATPEVETP